MAQLANRSVLRLGEILCMIFLFILMVSISPLLIAFYLMCWIRAKLTALIYTDIGILSGSDMMVGMEFNSKNTVINTVVILNDHLSVDYLKDLAMNNVINQKDSNNKPQFHKLVCCLNYHAGYLVWTEKNKFDVNDHIRPFHGEPPHDEVELKSVINHLCNTSLDLTKPVWEIHVIPTEYLQTNGRQTCLLFRLHHSIADGISLYRLFIEQLGGNHGALKHIMKQMENKLSIQSNFQHKIVAFLSQLKEVFGSTLATPLIMFKQIFNKDKYHHQKIKSSGVIIFDWTSTIKMSTIKDIKNATSTTVNDVLLSCLAGACRKYLLRQGVHPPNFIKSVMPIAIHNPDGPVQLINESLTVFHRLPTGDMDCIQRLKATKLIMDNLKCSPDIFITRWLVKHLLDVVPYSVMKWLYDFTEFNVVISNIPGPFTEVLFDGHAINSCFGLAPTRSCCYFGLVAVSYAGNLTLCLTVDTAIIRSKEEAGLFLNDCVEEIQLLYDSVIPAQSHINDKCSF